VRTRSDRDLPLVLVGPRTSLGNVGSLSSLSDMEDTSRLNAGLFDPLSLRGLGIVIDSAQSNP
jgi:hypothetical protein